MMDVEQIARAYAKFYESLTPQTSLQEYGVFFDKNSLFSDPFQSVEGLVPIYAIFENMYKTLHQPRFVVDEVVSQGEVAYLKWRFIYGRSAKGREESFSGVSRVLFSPSAKVKSHEDFWDAASNVYEKFPLLGSLLRFIKHKIHTKQ